MSSKVALPLLPVSIALLSGCMFFRKPPRDHFIGTWTPSTKARTLQPGQKLTDFPIITFAKGGAYYEHYTTDLLVGTWRIVGVRYNSGDHYTWFTTKIDYQDGTSISVVIFGISEHEKFSEIDIENKNGTGPNGYYDLLSRPN